MSILRVIDICNYLDAKNKYALSDKIFSKIAVYGLGGGGANVTDMLMQQVEWDERFEDEVDELDKGRQGEPTSSGWVNPRKLEPEGHGQNVSADEMNSIEAQNHPDEVDGSGAKVIIPDTLGVSAINDPTFLDRFEYENRDDEDAAVRRLPNNRII
jgi:hypothetical protein